MMGKGKEKIQWKNQLINMVAIIVGVYIAFYLTERQAASRNRDLASDYMASMADDLASDIEQLQFSTDTTRHYVDAIARLAQKINTQQIPREDSLMQMISSLYFYTPFIPKDNSYQSLLASGNIDIIPTFELRKRITTLYHQYYGAIKITDEITMQQRNGLIMPYLMNNLIFRAKGLVNAETLWKDNMFGNVVMTTRYGLGMKFQHDSIALVEAKKLKALLESELK